MLPDMTMLNYMNVLVTGASGFVGSELIRAINHFAPEARIFATAKSIDLKRPLYGQLIDGHFPLFTMVEKIIDCDLRNRDDVVNAVAVADPDVVFHLGALTQVTEARVQFYNAMMTNAIGTLNVLDACHAVRPKKIKIVISTTDKVYGSARHSSLTGEVAGVVETLSDFGIGRGFLEVDRLSPTHPYDVSKACADIVAQGFGEYFEERIFIARLANVYGPGDTNFKRLIPGLIRWGILQEKPVLRSDGKQMRQYIFINDAVSALIHGVTFLLSNEPCVGVFNFANGEPPRQVMEVYAAVKRALRAKGIHLDDAVILNKATDETTQLVINPYGAYEVLGWRPKVTFEKGLENTIEWMEAYLRRERIRHD